MRQMARALFVHQAQIQFEREEGLARAVTTYPGQTDLIV